ncbi:MAG: hypothetical protein LWX52_15240 [Deltaproteobacteria bacterium]|nr:hypothetical protein [Deltaproteobacteria bacterium]
MNRRKNGWRKDLGSARHVVSAGISAAWATNMVLAGFIKLDILGVGSALDSCPEFIRVKSRLDPFPDTLMNVMEPFLSSLSEDDAHSETLADLKESRKVFGKDIEVFQKAVKSANAAWTSVSRDNEGLKRFSEDFVPVAGKSRELGRRTDRIYRLALRLVELCEKKLNARKNDLWAKKEINQSKKPLDEKRKTCVEQLRQARYSTGRPVGFRNASRNQNCSMWRDLSSWSASRKSKRTTGVSPRAAMWAWRRKRWMRTSTSRKPCAQYTPSLMS